MSTIEQQRFKEIQNDLKRIDFARIDENIKKVEQLTNELRDLKTKKANNNVPVKSSDNIQTNKAGINTTAATIIGIGSIAMLLSLLRQRGEGPEDRQ